jgi:hypothetical protein
MMVSKQEYQQQTGLTVGFCTDIMHCERVEKERVNMLNIREEMKYIAEKGKSKQKKAHCE